MGKDVTLRKHKINDQIVVDAIRGVNEIFYREGGFISGGMAIQAYTSKEKHRGTVDLDTDSYSAGGKHAFEDKFAPAFGYLNSRGYGLKVSKKSFTYDVKMENQNDSFMIQHPRRSVGNLSNSRGKSLEREIANRRIVNLGDLEFPVISPEDIFTHKISRMLRFREGFNTQIPRGYCGETLLEKANELREKIIVHPEDFTENDLAQMRTYFDAYDLTVLSEAVNLDGKYFQESVDDFSFLKQNEREVHKIIDGFGISFN